MDGHEFGIMEHAPEAGKRYETYEPEKYHCIFVPDESIAALNLEHIPCFWHGLDAPAQGLAYCGITLLPPESLEAFIRATEGNPDLAQLKTLLAQAHMKGQYIIHFGL